MKNIPLNNLLKAAVAYGRKLKRIFPLVPGGKVPLTPSGFKDSTTDKAAVQGWWRQHPKANIGMPTGAGNGLLVVDVDPDSGGTDSLRELVEKYGDPETLRSRTPSGGAHLFFQYPADREVRNSTGVLPGIDVRGEGGYVVVPPSVGSNGKSYSWVDADVDPAPVPDWLLELILNRSKKPMPTDSEKVPQGQRNDYLFKRGCKMRRQGADVAEILDALLVVNQHRCQPPLDVAEVENIAKSASRYDPAESQDADDDPIFLQDPEPWAKTVDGNALANRIAGLLGRFLAISSEAVVAITLWTFHTFLLGATDVSPILGITSPTKRWDKTLLLEILINLVRRPLGGSNVTTAVFFRFVDAYQPTLLVDEADTFFKSNPELRGVINSSHRRSLAYVLRNVKSDGDYRPSIFRTWAAKAIALIGKLAGTLQDRAIEIRMRRKRPNEAVDYFDRKKMEPTFAEIRQQLARWAGDNLEALKEADPALPESLNDRAKDNWRPLLAIADRLGGNWPRKARKAAKALSAAVDEGDNSDGIQLLEDLRALFDKRGTDKLETTVIRRHLEQMDDRSWAEYRRGKVISAQGVAALLRPFEIRPKQLNFGDRNPRGYTRADFEDAWDRTKTGIPTGRTVILSRRLWKRRR